MVLRFYSWCLIMHLIILTTFLITVRKILVCTLLISNEKAFDYKKHEYLCLLDYETNYWNWGHCTRSIFVFLFLCCVAVCTVFFSLSAGLVVAVSLVWLYGTIEQRSSTCVTPTPGSTRKHLMDQLEPWTSSGPCTHEDWSPNWVVGMPETSSIISLIDQNHINNW
jgi:hypothetical protein